MERHFIDDRADEYMSSIFQTVYPTLEKDQVIKWLRKAPAATTLRISLESISLDDFLSRIRELLPDNLIASPHPTVQDIVIIRSISEEVKPEDAASGHLVVVGALCAAAVLRGADVYAPGVQAAPNNLQVNDLVNIYADPCNKVLKGSKTNDWIKSSLPILKDILFVGKGLATMTRDDLFKVGKTEPELVQTEKRNEKKSGIAIKVTQSLSNCPRLSDDDCATLKDTYMMQNIPSTLCGHILDPKPEDKILDMCAAPGGKTSHLASLLKRQCSEGTCPGIIYACDRSQNKINQIKETCERLKVSDVVEAFVQDGTRIKFEGVFQQRSFDKILLDAPCSALGQRPQFFQEKTLKELWSYSNLQKKLFAKAMELLKIGGILVYSTCTLTLEENEGLVAWALQEFPCLQLELPSITLGRPGVLVPGLTLEQAKNLQRFGNPEQADSLDDTIGFFIAKFRLMGAEFQTL